MLEAGLEPAILEWKFSISPNTYRPQYLQNPYPTNFAICVRSVYNSNIWFIARFININRERDKMITFTNSDDLNLVKLNRYGVYMKTK